MYHFLKLPLGFLIFFFSAFLNGSNIPSLVDLSIIEARQELLFKAISSITGPLDIKTIEEYKNILDQVSEGRLGIALGRLLPALSLEIGNDLIDKILGGDIKI